MECGSFPEVTFGGFEKKGEAFDSTIDKLFLNGLIITRGGGEKIMKYSFTGGADGERWRIRTRNKGGDYGIDRIGFDSNLEKQRGD